MKTLVLYESQTGYTRRYAEWISKALGTHPLPLKKVNLDLLRDAELILFGGSVRGSLISGLEKMARLARKAGGKEVIFFCVGIRPATPRTLELLRKNNFGADAPPRFFYFQGGLDRDRLSPGDRTMLRVYQAMLKRRRDIHPEDAELLQLMRLPGDFADPAQIKPLLDTVVAYGSLNQPMYESAEEPSAYS